jgi:hypothetical protein
MMPEPSRFRAFVRPVAVLWAFRVAAGAAVAYPAVRALGTLGPSTSPDGDRILFAPGGLHLVEAIRLGGKAIGASVESASVVAVLLSMVALLPLAVALGALIEPAAGLPGLIGRALARLPVLLVLGGATVLVQALVSLGTSLVVSDLSDALGSLTSELRADLWLTGVVAAGWALVLTVGIVQDLGRAAIMRHGCGLGSALTTAIEVLAGRPLSVLRGWGGPAAGAGLVIATAAWGTGAIDVSRAGGGRVAAVLLLHQIATLTLAALRVRWLGTALGLVGTARSATHPELPISPE